MKKPNFWYRNLKGNKRVYCRNPHCREVLPDGQQQYCASCRYIGRIGVFLGGVIVGAVWVTVQLIKLLK